MHDLIKPVTEEITEDLIQLIVLFWSIEGLMLSMVGSCLRGGGIRLIIVLLFNIFYRCDILDCQFIGKLV